MNKTTDNNDLVVINLDRPRVVRFGHKALKMMTSMTTFSMENIDDTNFDLSELEKILYCGILQDSLEHGENLKLEDMEDLLDKAEFHEIMDVMNTALGNAFKKTAKEIEKEKN